MKRQFPSIGWPRWGVAAISLCGLALARGDEGTRVQAPVFAGQNVEIEWNSAGQLQTAPTVNGPWTTVDAQTLRHSLATLPASLEHRFFRVVENGRALDPAPLVGGDPSRPFKVQRAFVRKAATARGNALIEAELAEGQNPPLTFPLLNEDQVLVFRDDGQEGDLRAGDGIFTAAIRIDENELRAANEFVKAQPEEWKVTGAFSGRSLLAGVLPTLFDFDGFLRGERVLAHPSPFEGRGLVPEGAAGGRAGALGQLRALAGTVETICTTNISRQPVMSISNVTVRLEGFFVTNIDCKPVEVLRKTAISTVIAPGIEPVPGPEPVPNPVCVTNVVFIPGGETITNILVTNFVLVTNIACTNLVIGGIDTNVITLPIDDVLKRPVFWNKSLLITDLSAVEDPRRTWDPCHPERGTKMGAWTFGRLMADVCNEAASGIDPSEFTRRWLRSWQHDLSINFDTVTNRNPEILAQAIQDWELASGEPGAPLDLSIAPFRLLAIVNRVDLRSNPGYGGAGLEDACSVPCIGGEGRFVFALVPGLRRSGGGGGGYGGGAGGDIIQSSCDAAQFTVIFEYCVPKRTCAEIRDYALQWYALARMDFGPAFNDALQRITDQFARAGADPSRKPNLSALNQLRANELLREPWDMREWRLFNSDSDAGWLREVTVKQTPDFDLNFTSDITEYCLANAGQILAAQHTVPLQFGRAPFLGGNAPMPSRNFFWDGPQPTGSIPGQVRHMFSLNTCSGCHAGETGTPFTHVFPRPAGAESALSDFLTGRNMPKLDPADHVTARFFADLKRREDDLLRLIREPCFFQLFHEPARFQD